MADPDRLWRLRKYSALISPSPVHKSLLCYTRPLNGKVASAKMLHLWTSHSFWLRSMSSCPAFSRQYPPGTPAPGSFVLLLSPAPSRQPSDASGPSPLSSLRAGGVHLLTRPGADLRRGDLLGCRFQPASRSGGAIELLREQ